MEQQKVSDTKVEQLTTDGSETTEEKAPEKAASDTTSSAGDDFKPITSQRDLELALKERLDRERAKFKDYNDLKAKAAKFDQVTAAAKSDLELAIERATAAEQKAAMLEAEREIAGFKAEVSKKTGVPVDVLRGSTLEEIQDHAASVKALLPEPRKPGHVPAEGRTVNNGTGDPAQQFAELIREARR